MRTMQFICISSFWCLVLCAFDQSNPNLFIEQHLTSVDAELQKMPNKKAATKKAMVRAIKLFILGVIFEGYTYPYFVNFPT